MDQVNIVPNFTYTFATINLNGISNTNKMNSLRSFVRSLDLDVIAMQEVVSSSICIPGYEMIVNINETERGTAIAVRNGIEVIRVQRSLDSRVICIDLGNVENRIRIINLYAPSGSNNRAVREDFFNRTVPFYLQNHPFHTIMLGDFNSVIDSNDATGSSNMSPMFKRLCDSVNLKDVWKQFNQQIDYSFVRGRSMSRIDRIYVTPACLPNVRYCRLEANCFSDHKAVISRIVLPMRSPTTQRPFWKLNNHLMTEENLMELRAKWNYWTRQKRNYQSWVDWWFSYAKGKIASFFRWKNSISVQTFNNTIGFYHSCLNRAYEEHRVRDCTTEINKIKAIMLQKQKQFSESRKNTSAAFLGGEDISIFQIADRASRQRETTIASLDINGQRITDKEEINRYVQQHYQQLFDEEDIAVDARFNPRRTLDENNEDNDRVMEDLTEDEVFSAIKGSAANKSPGKDGLTKEFYQKCWEIIKRQFLLILNEIKNGRVTDDLQDGVVVLVRKKGVGNGLNSLRPITLLNVDYKIFSRVMKQRIEKMSTAVLSPHQKCSNGNHTIFEATCVIRDHIAISKQEGVGGIVIAFDLSNAFDRVNHSYLLSSMSRMRFNTRFVDLMTNLSRRQKSQLLINGHITQNFRIKRSVRQGDPLSMLLFVLYIQPLLDNLAEICNAPGECVIAYADDITIIIRSSAKIQQILQCFERFGLAAGAKLNMQKTVAMEIGAQLPEWDGLIRKDTIKVLGVLFKNNIKDTVTQNWEAVYRSVNGLLWMHRPRVVNIMQKVMLLNTYICSKLWYLSSILPMPNKYIAMFTKQIGFFLWSGVPSQRVKMVDIVRPKSQGGLGLHSPDLKTKALLVNRYLRTLNVTPSLDHYMQLPNTPSDLLHIKTIKAVLQGIPQHIQDEPEAKHIYQHLLNQLPAIGVTTRFTRNWKMVWKNIKNNKLSSDEKSIYFLLVHGKLHHNELFFRQERRDDPNCQTCGQCETIEHKFSTCQRVDNMWQTVITDIRVISQQQDITFENLRFPTINCERRIRSKILKMFIRYIMFNLEVPDDNRNTDSLRSYLAMYI